MCFKKEHGLDNELMNLALLSSPRDMLDVARSVLHFVFRELRFKGFQNGKLHPGFDSFRLVKLC